MQAQGYGPNYSQGYGHGCETGKKSAGDMFSQFKKDVNRFDSNYKYREGWKDGFRTCKSEFAQIERNVRANSRDQAIRDSYKDDSRSDDLDNVARDAARDSMDNMSYSDRRALQNLGR
jgi:hypothetical protein